MCAMRIWPVRDDQYYYWEGKGGAYVVFATKTKLLSPRLLKKRNNFNLNVGLWWKISSTFTYKLRSITVCLVEKLILTMYNQV